ncbi:MAG: hypothetical protein FWE42_07585 [Defluviitaleaceae bacterium]|nr:hypothetical protein [Defluviitaleaceae bacterium]
MSVGKVLLILGLISIPIFLFLGIEHDPRWGFLGNFYLLGLIGSSLFIIGGLALDFMYKKSKAVSQNVKKCPFCANALIKEAIVCQFCGKDLPKD